MISFLKVVIIIYFYTAITKMCCLIICQEKFHSSFKKIARKLSFNTDTRELHDVYHCDK